MLQSYRSWLSYSFPVFLFSILWLRGPVFDQRPPVRDLPSYEDFASKPAGLAAMEAGTTAGASYAPNSGCTTIQGTIYPTDKQGVANVEQFNAWQAIYLSGSKRNSNLIGQDLYVKVTDPITDVGRTTSAHYAVATVPITDVDSTTTGHYTVATVPFSIHLLDYVQVMANTPSKGIAYKLVVSTSPLFPTGACTKTNTFKVLPPTPTPTSTDTPTSTNTPTSTATNPSTATATTTLTGTATNQPSVTTANTSTSTSTVTSQPTAINAPVSTSKAIDQPTATSTPTEKTAAPNTATNTPRVTSTLTRTAITQATSTSSPTPISAANATPTTTEQTTTATATLTMSPTAIDLAQLVPMNPSATQQPTASVTPSPRPTSRATSTRTPPTPTALSKQPRIAKQLSTTPTPSYLAATATPTTTSDPRPDPSPPSGVGTGATDRYCTQATCREVANTPTPAPGSGGNGRGRSGAIPFTGAFPPAYDYMLTIALFLTVIGCTAQSELPTALTDPPAAPLDSRLPSEVMAGEATLATLHWLRRNRKISLIDLAHTTGISLRELAEYEYEGHPLSEAASQSIVTTLEVEQEDIGGGLVKRIGPRQ